MFSFNTRYRWQDKCLVIPQGLLSAGKKYLPNFLINFGYLGVFIKAEERTADKKRKNRRRRAAIERSSVTRSIIQLWRLLEKVQGKILLNKKYI